MSAADSNESIAFIDTNIWLYAFSDSQDKQKSQRAKDILQKTSQITLSTQVINEVSFNMIRKFHADEADVRRLIQSLYRKYLVVELSQTIFINASELRSLYHISYWDSLIIASALDIGARILYTEDMHNRLIIRDQLTIINPFTQ